ncbi:MAG: CAP domain-containing protein [Cyclobacteriaceae bacterium]
MKTLSVILTFLLFLNCSESKTSGDVSPDKMQDQIFVLVNKHRESKGLASLQINSACQREAQTHSEKMADGTTPYGHDGFDDRFDILAEETGAMSMGENVANGQTSAAEVMEGWLDSKGHRENIEGDYTHIGIGVAASSDGTMYFTQIFVGI